jgi:Flp pilus assembly protein TadG
MPRINQINRKWRRGASSNRGQALAEMGFVVVLLTFLVMGIVELGWAFMRSSMFVHSLRDGGRYGATLGGSTYRDPSTNLFTSAGIAKIKSHVESLALSTMGYTLTDGNITVAQTCDTTVPIVTVTIHDAPFPMLFNLIPGTGSLTVNRSIVFEDEDRKCS